MYYLICRCGSLWAFFNAYDSTPYFEKAKATKFNDTRQPNFIARTFATDDNRAYVVPAWKFRDVEFMPRNWKPETVEIFESEGEEI